MDENKSTKLMWLLSFFYASNITIHSFEQGSNQFYWILQIYKNELIRNIERLQQTHVHIMAKQN